MRLSAPRKSEKERGSGEEEGLDGRVLACIRKDTLRRVVRPSKSTENRYRGYRTSAMQLRNKLMN